MLESSLKIEAGQFGGEVTGGGCGQSDRSGGTERPAKRMKRNQSVQYA